MSTPMASRDQSTFESGTGLSRLTQRSRRLAAVALTGVLALSGCAADDASVAESRAEDDDVARLALGTKATYPAIDGSQELESAPEGYEPVLVEHVARHGSRLLSSKKYDDLITQLWELADDDDALTDTGEKLGPVVADITAVHEETGYGELSELGRREHAEMAERVYQRMNPVFERAVESGQKISVETSGVDRAVDSATSFIDSLEDADPQLSSVVGEPQENTETLYFHDTDEEYNAYMDGDDTLAEVLDEVENDPEIQSTSAAVLERLFTPEFISELDSGTIDLVDRGDGDKHLNSVVDAAMYLYELRVIAPGMADEQEIDFSEFLTDEDALVLSRVSEAEDFYEKGPGLTGQDATFSMAGGLLADMLDAIDGVATGETRQAADFRFAHAEEIIPLAALMELPGSSRQQEPDSLFSYENNEWRGSQIAPMGANIQWDVFADNSDDVLVRMLYNEEQTAFGLDCRPIDEGSYFYEQAELQRCLAEAAGDE
ncbi:histidine-type phosphatase [Brevibacterium sp. FAM 27836]|uniref:histidine-type phosphatase n=1 Tax=Brevibacterium sp. FAM 27836 TaxID=3446693 RepID=UPI003F517160